MGFMVPVAEFFAAYHVETECGTEIVPEDICGTIDTDDMQDDNEYDLLRDYIEGSDIESVERKEGWYARLSAPGYLDCTEYTGPFGTSAEALAEVKKFYEVDDNGDGLDYGDGPDDDNDTTSP